MKREFPEDEKEKEKLRVKALESQNAENYYLLCNEIGTRDHEDEELYNQGMFLVSQEELREEIRKIEQEPDGFDAGKYLKYSNLFQETRRRGLSVDNVFSQPEIKARLLEEIMGYKKLKVQDGRAETRNCSDARIGKVFQRCYREAERYLKEY